MTVSNSQPKSASQPLLCLTITGYKKPGMPDDEYRAYMAKQHASLVGPLMEEYGIVSYTQTHNDAKSRSLLYEIFDPQFSNLSDYDCIVQIVFRRLEDFLAMKNDARYKANVGPDHVKFADTKRSTMSIGYHTDVVNAGKFEIKGI